MEIWLKRHPVESFPWVVREAEKVVGVPLCEGIEFFMKRDLLVEMKDTKICYPLDHKTTGKITSWWSNKFKLGSQMTGYVWGTGQEQGNTPPGAFINAIELGKLPEPGEKKCATHKTPYAECWQAHAKGELFIVGRTPEKLETWYKDACELARRLRDFALVGKNWDLVRMLPQEGMFNDGCTFCEFAEFCRYDRRPETVETFLQFSPWEPWAVGV
jgi:hypothetical protein